MKCIFKFITAAALMLALNALLVLPALSADANVTAANATRAADIKKAVSVSSDPAMLVKAFKREFSFLDTQKRALQARKVELDRQQKRKKAAHDRILNNLENSLLELDREIGRTNQNLSEVEGQLEKDDENSQLVEVTINQAKETLKGCGIKISDFRDGERLDDQQTLELIFEKTTDLLGRLSSINKEEGAFFLADGSQVSGSIIRVGRIASYGISEKSSGCLIPAGEGYFKLWNPQDTEPVIQTASALSNNSALPSTIGIFLYDNPDKAVQPPKQRNIKDVLRAGGIVGHIIIALGFLAAVMVLVRFVRLAVAAHRNEAVESGVTALVKENKVDEAVEFCQSKSGVMARVLAPVLEIIDYGRTALEYVITESLLREGSKLDLFKNAINAVAMVSPLLGLLGTVAGIIKTFEVIVEFGTGNPKMMAGGISEALVTTELGLIVAIPIYIVATLLSGWADRIKGDIEEATLKVINLYHQGNGNDE